LVPHRSSTPDRADSGPAVSAQVDPEFLSGIIDAIAHPVFVKDRQFRFVIVNRALEQMVGHSRADMLGKDDFDFFPREQAEFFRQKDQQMFATGEPVWIDEEPITDAFGRTHVLCTTKVPLRNAQGETTHLVGVIREITRLKETEEALRQANEQLDTRTDGGGAELRQAQQEILRKERFTVLGQLAGGVAHELRNPLAAIANAVAVMERRLDTRADQDVATALCIVQEEVWAANHIISDLLDYARIRPPTYRPALVREIVDAALELKAIPNDISVERQVTEELELVADERQIRDALGNLVRNALEAMPAGGTLRVTARADADTLTLVVADTGQGVPEGMQPLLFEPLVSSKPMGLGLGLATARALVENHGGTLRCVSTGGPGARFEMVLPRNGRSGPAED
jgi:PAS domain S-box-containing protein